MGKTGKKIKRMLAQGHFALSLHAAERSAERMISESDIMECGASAKKVVFQEDKGTWKVNGSDLDGDDLTVVCKLKGDLLIVTMYRKS